MPRFTATKFVATALTVASLGFAASAQADEMDQPQGADQAQAAQVEQAPQDQGQDQNQAQPEQNIAIGEPVPGTNPNDPVNQDQGEDPDNPVKGPEADQRFQRYCNMKDAEPSHSDKAFCEAYRKAHTTTTTPGTTTPGGKGTTDTSTWPKDDTTHYDEPTYYKHHTYYPAKTVRYAPSSSSSSLPFTGLELWQLALLGVVLIGGGIGARKALLNRS